MHPPDDLDEYLRGDSALSCQYRRESAPTPPSALDRRVLEMSRAADHAPVTQAAGPARSKSGHSAYLAPLAFAACVLTSVALVLAIVFGPQTPKRADDVPHVVRVATHVVLPPPTALDPKHARPPSAWLADIAALRRAGRNREADEEMRRFRSVYPVYPAYPSVARQ